MFKKLFHWVKSLWHIQNTLLRIRSFRVQWIGFFFPESFFSLTVFCSSFLSYGVFYSGFLSYGYFLFWLFVIWLFLILAFCQMANSQMAFNQGSLPRISTIMETTWFIKWDQIHTYICRYLLTYSKMISF